MARTTGIFIATVTTTGIEDGGDVEMDVFTPAGEPVATVAMSVANGSSLVDVPSTTTDGWPDNIRMTISATRDNETKIVTVRNSQGRVEFYRITSSTSTPSLIGMGTTLSGSAHTFTWSDPFAPVNRQYTITINGITKNGTVLSPVSQWYVTGLPVDGSSVEVVLSWWDGYDLATLESVTGYVTAHTQSAGPGSQFIIPVGNIAEGNYGSADWVNGIGSGSASTWESNNNTLIGTSTVAGKRSFGVRLDDSVVPSTRVGATADLTPSNKATFEQWVYFDAGFEWGGTNEAGKLGFGLGGGSRPLDGPAKTDGFSSLFTWGTNGAIYAQVLDGRASADGTYYSLNYTASRATWFKLTMAVEMNSVAGIADGKLTVSVNDVVALARTDMEWFAEGTPQVDVFQHYTYHDGSDGTWSPSRVNHVYFAEIYWIVGLEEFPSVVPTYSEPADGSTAESADVTFSWSGRPGYVYDLHVYSDAARTIKVRDTNGNIMDTIGIGTATSHTFLDDPSDGTIRYVRLYWWPDNSYAFRDHIDWQYVAYSGVYSVLDVAASQTSFKLKDSLGLVVTDAIPGQSYTIEVDWVDSAGQYAGTGGDSRVIPMDVDVGSEVFVNRIAGTNTNRYAYTPPSTSNTIQTVTFTWGKYDDETHTSLKEATRQITLLESDENTIPTDLSGYVSFLNVGTADQSLGTVTDAEYTAMTNPIPNYFSNLGTSRRGVSTVAGRKALQVELIPNPSTSGVGSNKLQSGHRLPSVTQELWLTHATYLPNGWDYGGSADRQTMKFGPGIFGGVLASGGNPSNAGFSVRTTYRGINSGAQAEWSIYKYAADQVGTYGDEINNLNNGSPLIVKTGTWQHHVMYVKVNTNTSTSNGILRYWVDGVKVYEKTNIRYFSEGTPQIQDIRADIFMGGTNTVNGHWAADSTQVLAVSNWGYATTDPFAAPRAVTLHGGGGTLAGSSHTFTFSDTRAISGTTRYTIFINDVSYSGYVTAPATSILATGLPTDGGTYTVRLAPPVGYVGDNFIPATASFTAAIGSVYLQSPAVLSNLTATSMRLSFTANTFVKAMTEVRTIGGSWVIKANEISFNYQSHVQNITGLVSNTNYEYRITIEDAAGSIFTTTPVGFTTIATQTGDATLPFGGLFGGAPQLNSYGPGNTEGGTRMGIRVHLDAGTYTGYSNSVRYLRSSDVTGRAASNSRYQDIIDAGMNDTPLRRNKAGFYMKTNRWTMGSYIVGNGGAYIVELRPVANDGYPNMSGSPLATTAPNTFVPLDHVQGAWPEMTFANPVTLSAGWYYITLINQKPARYEDLPSGMQNGRTGYVYAGLSLAECDAMPDDRGHMTINGFALDKTIAGSSVEALQGPFLSSTNVCWDHTGSDWTGAPGSTNWDGANKPYWLLRKSDGNYIGQSNHVEFGWYFSTNYNGSTGYDVINVEGATMIKQSFIQRVDRQIRTIIIPLGFRYDIGSTAGLTVRLRNAGGSIIATATIAYSQALKNLVAGGASPIDYRAFNGKAWLTGTFDNNPLLTTGSSYSLEFSAAAGAGWFITGWEPAPEAPKVNLWAELGLGGTALKSLNSGASYGEFSKAGAYRKGNRYISHLLTWVGYPDGTTPL